MEEWRPVVGHPEYSVSNQGRVRGSRGWVLSPRPDTHGYHRAYIEGSEMRVNRLVALAFVGPIPDGRPHCGHLNGVRTDNRAENLAWVSPTENMAHRVLHGTVPRGSKHQDAKLSERDVHAIRAALVAGERVMHLSTQYGVARCTISNIKARRIWGWLPDE